MGPKALLFSTKIDTSVLLKSLSVKMRGRMLIGDVVSTSKAVVGAFEVTSFPTLFVLPATGDPIKYAGEFKPEVLSTFLAEHAAATPSDDKQPAPEDSLVTSISKENLASDVEASKDPWVLVFKSDASPSSAELETLAESVYGQVNVATAVADLAETYGVTKLPAAVVLPFGTGAKSPKKAKKFKGDEAGLAEAKKAALETLPENFVQKVSMMQVDQWMSGALGAADAQAVCMLFTEKSEVPPIFRSVSMQFDGQLSFAQLPAQPQLMQRFNIQKAPALLVMFPGDTSNLKEGEQMQLQGMQFTPKMHGKFSYGNIAKFLSDFIDQRLAQLGHSSGQAEERKAERESAQKAKASKAATPLVELTKENFDDECTNKGGLCAIVLLDGSPENSNKDAHIEMITKLKNKRAGGPLSFSWLDATCHSSFAAHFELSEMDLPTMIVLSPSKMRWARAVGAFDATTLGAFGTGVATGRQGTDILQALPTLEDVDCSTIKRGADAVVEEDALGDEIMQEILEEERREREAREAESAPASSEGSKEVKDTSSMSELERMEAELEECTAMDLLCAARREKQLAKIEKKRALEEKLKEIARKKKKKAKKAKKKAAAA